MIAYRLPTDCDIFVIQVTKDSYGRNEITSEQENVDCQNKEDILQATKIWIKDSDKLKITQDAGNLMSLSSWHVTLIGTVLTDFYHHFVASSIRYLEMTPRISANQLSLDNDHCEEVRNAALESLKITWPYQIWFERASWLLHSRNSWRWKLTSFLSQGSSN